ncbi:MAG TPA: FKBP-type peptidyl-prolyl cis-trans isomerase [Ilumatobacter sp.]
MGTEKRERQKANRQQRLAEQARTQRVTTVKRTAVRWVVGGIIALGAVVLIAWIGGAFDSDEAVTPPELTAPVEVTAPVGAATPADKPAVSIPAELPTELVVTDLLAGTGPAAQVGDTVLVNYVGVRSADGTEFDNSYDRGSPFPVTLGSGGVIQGWDQGLLGVQAGGRRQLDIPADLAYGDSAVGEIIQSGDALTFVIDVVSVTPAGS